MAYIDQSSNFGYGTVLTSVQVQNLRDNLRNVEAEGFAKSVLTDAANESYGNSLYYISALSQATEKNDLAQKNDWLNVIHHGVNRGLGGVYRSGFSSAKGEYLTFYPAWVSSLP